MSRWLPTLLGYLLPFWIGMAGLLAIELMNVVRISSLFVIQRHWPDSFHLWHTTIWEAVFVLLAVLLWALWAARVVRPPGEGR